jgi:hypothetical protein
VSTRLDHRARDIATWRAGVPRVLAEHVEDVTEVEADGAHTQRHLASAGWRCKGGLRLDEEVADRASAVKVQPHETIEGGRRGVQAWGKK